MIIAARRDNSLKGRADFIKAGQEALIIPHPTFDRTLKSLADLMEKQGGPLAALEWFIQCSCYFCLVWNRAI